MTPKHIGTLENLITFDRHVTCDIHFKDLYELNFTLSLKSEKGLFLKALKLKKTPELNGGEI